MEYKLIRSKRKTVGICIDENCDIIVRAPMQFPVYKIEKLLSENEAWIDKASAKQQAARKNKIELSEEDIKKLKKLAKDILPERTEYFANLMGVEYGTVRITSAEKRFGSCSGKNNISYSFRLMLYPPEAIDYVVVHELSHTIYHNHSKDFYNLLKKIMPDYKERENLLKKQQTLPY